MSYKLKWSRQNISPSFFFSRVECRGGRDNGDDDLPTPLHKKNQNSSTNRAEAMSFADYLNFVRVTTTMWSSLWPSHAILIE